MNTHIIRQYLQNVSNTIFKFRREGQVQLDIRIKGVFEQMHYYQLSNMQITLSSHERLIKRKKYGEISPDIK